MNEEIEIRKLPRHDILNLKAVLEKLADSKPVQQEIEDIFSRLEALEAEDILEHLARGKMLEEKVADLKREVSILTQLVHIKLLEMWSRISDIQTFVGMPKESE